MIKFELLKKNDELPYNLLLLADETKDAINKYIFESDVYLAKIDNKNIGVFCLYRIDDKTVELKNIALDENYQSKGFGSIFIDFIKETLKYQYEILIVGTASIGIRQINFYEKNGFVKFGVRKDFFIENYKEPIFENGIQLKDMILLKYKL
ncbi:GNAT family N-acetyltransferase [Chishuiella sp.]|uniref:GNAT family N-acetyltransferase n=1 Tax=Chishuiella sp. TaxID=1969467 RepID=UPI0028B170D5|nr:GNAT family N-acetyltransferase [Chishuiella sp.]